MSSRTDYHVTSSKPPTYRITSVGKKTVALDELLGINGCNRLLDTLKSLGDIRKKLGLKGTSMLNWKKTGSKDTGGAENYQLKIVGADLPEELKKGILNINLRISPYVAEVSHHYQYETTQRRTKMSETVREKVRQTRNRMVNQLLTVSVANFFEEKIRQYVRPVTLQNKVQMRIAENFNVRTYAEVRHGF
jgi:hypothetical protein